MHFPPVPQCDVKVLLLIFSPKKRAFVGLIPVEQVCVSYIYYYKHCLVCVLYVYIRSISLDGMVQIVFTVMQ